MSPPEVWGPPIWTLFHCIAEKIHPNAYPSLVGSAFSMIRQICKVLPCPECSQDASRFLGKINIQNYKTKHDFKVLFYLFHNYVNTKKRKPLFHFSKLTNYSNLNMNMVVNNFIHKYHTRGNMKLLTESFQRGFVVKNFIAWYKTNYLAFHVIPIPQQTISAPAPAPAQVEAQVEETVETVEAHVETHVEESS